MPKKDVVKHIKISKKLDAGLKKSAAKEDETESEIMRKALRKYIAENNEG